MDIDSQHIMIDLETMGISCISAIVSIGAVQFSLNGQVKDLYHVGVDLRSCVSVGMDLDSETVLWWLKQSKINQDRLLALQTISLQKAITGLFNSFNGLDKYKTYLWSHGSNFDTVIIENACRLVGIPIWWKYSNVRDTRTLFDVYNYKYTAKGGHDALEDARNQAEAVIAACS